MTVFTLETDVVTSGATNVATCGTNTGNLGGTVSGYDSSAEDGFDFASAISTISANVKTSSEKMKKTSENMEKVVSDHTSLQNSLKFEYDPDAKTDAEETPDPAKPDNTGENNQDQSNNNNNNNNNNYGNNSGNYYDSSSYTGGGYNNRNRNTNTTQNVKEKVKKVDYVSIADLRLDEKGTNIMNSGKVQYKDGYAKMDDYYLIECGTDIGKVGDIISFTLKNGQVIKCLVVANISEAGVVKFITDKDKLKEVQEKNEFKDLLSNSEKIEILGNIFDTSSANTSGVATPTSSNTNSNTSTNNSSSSTPVSYDVGNLDMDNYPTDLSRESSLQRGTLVAKYLMQNGNFSAEQAAAIAGVFVDENGCYPGDLNDGVKQQEIEWYGSGYGAGIGSWTGVNEKNQVLADAGYPAGTLIENLSLKEQCNLVIANSQKSSKTYYDALRRCNNIEDASATAVIITGGVGFSSNWSTHPTQAEAAAMAEYYGTANDSTFGYSDYHHNCDQRRLQLAKEILSRMSS